MILRAFADLPTRQVHYRHAGDDKGAKQRPLLMLHASPGSSKQLETKIAAMAVHRRVVAPDTPGNGDSTPLTVAIPKIGDYAAALVEFLDVVGLERCDVYGSHTGADIAVELCLRAPTRVGKVVIDGVGLYAEETREHYLANYARPMKPSLDGTHLLQAFMFCRDQYLFWPWFETAAANRREGGLPSADALHEWVVEVCKALTTYHLAYNAAFANRAEDRLPRLEHEALFLVASNDPLFEYTQGAVAMARRGRLCLLGHSATPGFAATLAAAMETFLSEPAAAQAPYAAPAAAIDG
jgi:pimeloyl-ACP methyl ester carboxylesterase